MAREEVPVTPAVRVLRAEKVEFEAHLYPYEEKGGTTSSSKALGVPEHSVVKTLVMEDDQRSPLIVLMHGDKQVSTKSLARALGVRSITPCSPDTANKHSGYLVGGTSPFGLKRAMPVYLESTIATLPRVYLNGGKRGFLVSLLPAELIRVLKPVLVSAATG